MARYIDRDKRIRNFLEDARGYFSARANSEPQKGSETNKNNREMALFMGADRVIQLLDDQDNARDFFLLVEMNTGMLDGWYFDLLDAEHFKDYKNKTYAGERWVCLVPSSPGDKADLGDKAFHTIRRMEAKK